jgi:hypothetical protein
MSRSDYSDDEKFPGEFALFRSNVDRSLQSKRGRAALLELREALLALSTNCSAAIAGARARDAAKRGIMRGKIRRSLPTGRQTARAACGVVRCVARKFAPIYAPPSIAIGGKWTARHKEPCSD